MMTITSPKAMFVMMSGERPIITAVKVRMHNQREHENPQRDFLDGTERTGRQSLQALLGSAGVSVSVL